MGLAGDRIADLVTAVPHNLADVEALAQHAIGLAFCAADGDLVPALASGPGNAGLVQPSRDGQRAQPRRVIAKNVTDDIGGLGINLAQTTFRLAIGPEHACYPAVAIDHAACRPAGPDASLQPTAGLAAEILQEHRIHRALKADMDAINIALAQGDKADFGKAHQLVEGCHMLLVAGDAIQGLSQDDIDPADTDGLLQCAKARPIIGGARNCGVVEFSDYRPALAFGANTADTELILNRIFRLAVAAIAGVDRDAGAKFCSQRNHHT